MSRTTEILLSPIKFGLTPVRRFGQSALDLTSSQRIGEIRIAESHKDRGAREIETAIALAHAVKGKIASGVVTDPEAIATMEASVDEAARRIGQIVLDASGADITNSYLHPRKLTDLEQ